MMIVDNNVTDRCPRVFSRAFVAALTAPRESIHNRAFNVGRTEDNYRIRELAEIVTNTVPGCTIEYAPDAGPDKRCYRVDFSRIRKALPGFQPEWNARAGAAQLYEAYKRTGVTVEDSEGPRYKRIDHIQKLILDETLDPQLRRKVSMPQPVAGFSPS